MADPVQAGDLDGCLRKIDDLVSTRSWDALEAHRTSCLAAFERGHQLWPAAHAAAYRLTLEAPAPFAAAAAAAAGDGTFFGLGPLTEVIASRLSWDELEPHLAEGPMRSSIAQERIARGEDLSDVGLDTANLGVGTSLADWEPTYTVATYTSDSADFGAQPLHQAAHLRPAPVDLTDLADTALADDDATIALRALTAAWTEQSNGRCEASAVAGTAKTAIAALGVRNCIVAPITMTEAAHLMAWTAASGGAHGRRRGIAAGRFDAWWTIAAICNMVDDWPVHPDQLGAAANEIHWYLWDPGHGDLGWSLHLAAEDPLDGLSWAVAATDARL